MVTALLVLNICILPQQHHTNSEVWRWEHHGKDKCEHLPRHPAIFQDDEDETEVDVFTKTMIANTQGNSQLAFEKEKKKMKEPPFLEPLSWRFPEEPTKDEPRFPPNFELRTPMAPESIKVICGENSIRVEAKRDLLGSGVLVQTTDVTLGGCAATEEDPKAQILIFESELHGCGSQLLMSEESFIYVFTLLYTPSPLGGSPIVRTIDVSVSIECHYRRKNDVSSDVLKPNWAPFSETKASEESLYFSLRLMTDNWQFPRSSTQFFLGDMMKFEASVEQFHHIPLRVTVDSCVATVVPNVDTVPRYAFLGNNGCMFDSQLTGSSSHFLPQSHKDKLQFELEAFRFQHGNSGVVRYATAFLPGRCCFHIIAQKCRFCFFVCVSLDIHYLQPEGHGSCCKCQCHQQSLFILQWWDKLCHLKRWS
uniref:Zona pellucida sperm-binding protein 3 n=1 Tax=Pundamilia nyererei TaxID=303518 RepID=A0A3B4FW73_9CICH